MRQTLTGMVAAIGLMTVGAAPAMACWGGCSQTYASAYTYAPAYSYSGCGTCGGYGYGYGYGYGGAGYEHLAAPTTQYYYANQGPTYTGPGAFAPSAGYQEDAVPVEHPARYGYYEGAGVEGPAVYGYHRYHRYHAWHHSYRYGYAPHHYSYHYGPYYYGRRVLRRYY